jgi:hypothetical protein
MVVFQAIMTIAKQLVTKLAFTIKDSTRELLNKAQDLPNIAKNLYAKSQIEELEKLHRAVDKNPEAVDPQEVFNIGTNLLRSMRNNELFKVSKLQEKLQAIFLADTNLSQKTKDIFSIADEILARLKLSGEQQEKRLQSA